MTTDLKRARTLFCISILLFLVARGASADRIPSIEYDRLYAFADLVVIGTLESSRRVYTETGACGVEYIMKVERWLKGVSSKQSVIKYRSFIGDAVGERLLLMLIASTSKDIVDNERVPSQSDILCQKETGTEYKILHSGMARIPLSIAIFKGDVREVAVFPEQWVLPPPGLPVLIDRFETSWGRKKSVPLDELLLCCVQEPVPEPSPRQKSGRQQGRDSKDVD